MSILTMVQVGFWPSVKANIKESTRSPKSLFEKCSKYIFAAALEADLSDFSNSLLALFFVPLILKGLSLRSAVMSATSPDTIIPQEKDEQTVGKLWVLFMVQSSTSRYTGSER